MELKELIKFIQKEGNRLKSLYNNCDDEKMILAITVKLNEEVGELCQEVLGNLKFLRKEKLEKHTPETLKEEFADVLITSLILVNQMGIDIEKAMEEKIDKINTRNNMPKDRWK
ncbi:MAG: MazG nucleotide pyrophosphohydrolase domain-containing protein [Candidatus Babeliales bacterium]